VCLVSYLKGKDFCTTSPQRPKQHDSSKRRYILISLHSALSQKTSICTKSIRTSNLTFLYNNLTSPCCNITCRNTPVGCTGVENSHNVDWDPHNMYNIHGKSQCAYVCEFYYYFLFRLKELPV